ncbi:MAG: aldo/keto reductase [Chromatiales bacterium]|jgi:D-threo-aldose 1-dehydrogenase|nr:aldo/keto reductase [Chromatiales bacterium]
MDPTTRRNLGQRGLALTQLGFGGAPLGDPGEATPEDQAQATLAAAWKGGLRFFDTAPWYGNTKSEHRFGYFLRSKPREQFVLSTKVGRVYTRPDKPEFFPDTQYADRWRNGLPFVLRFDYSGQGVRRSYEDSLQRLGINRVDCLVIHDLDPRHQNGVDGVNKALEQLDAGGGYAELASLRARGEIGAIGAGVNHVGMIPRLLERFDIDYFLVAMPYTLLDQDALDDEFALCERHGAKVVIGAVFASGILASGPGPGAQYGYADAPAPVREKVRRLAQLCEEHGTTLTAAALQFPLAHPAVLSVIPGAIAPEQVQNNIAAFQSEVPAEFWAALRRENLVRADAPLPA